MSDRHQTFHDLHQSGTFVIPNPWDMGSARLMAGLGAKALATTSSGHAFTLGRPDMGTVTRDEALAHAQDIVSATPLPVTGDFENGFADAPEEVAETIRLAAEAGLSGCSIEDTCMSGEKMAAYEFEHAVDRIKAAASAARALGHPFILCARADGLMNRFYDLDEAIRRLQAFEQAGADLLYAPIPPGPDELRAILGAITAPFNALAAGPLARLSVSEFADLGVRRISLGSMIARITHAAAEQSTREMLEQGTFTSLKGAADGRIIDKLLAQGAGTS